ncbi:endonuclease domain-containing 1 protein-like [Polypterus senegalus]
MQPLYLLIVAVALVATGTAEVMNDFSSCINFFFGEKPPTGFEEAAFPIPEERHPDDSAPDCLAAYQQRSPGYICQKIPNGNQSYFATLYDRGRRIPLFSAYLVEKNPAYDTQFGYIRVEPQLVHRELSAESQREADAIKIIEEYNKGKNCSGKVKEYQEKNKLMQSQAIEDDYKDAGKHNYDHIYLNPPQHHSQKEFCNATNTFTNIVAISKVLSKAWKGHEEEIKEVMRKSCEQMYVITGAVPSNDKKLKNRVYVPRYIWSAYCCVSNTGQTMHSVGVLLPNDNSEKMETMVVNQLEERLSNLYNHEIKLIEGC